MTLAESALSMSISTLLAGLTLTMGLIAALTSRGRNKPRLNPSSDEQLEERVREEFLRKIHHARSLQIDVLDGVVTVSGPILLDDVDTLISSIRKVPGVKRVEDHLQAHPAGKQTYLN
jgi:osmotically-inducible protein OsmY